MYRPAEKLMEQILLLEQQAEIAPNEHIDEDIDYFKIRLADMLIKQYLLNDQNKVKLAEEKLTKQFPECKLNKGLIGDLMAYHNFTLDGAIEEVFGIMKEYSEMKKDLSKCPECGGNTATYRHLNAKVWCTECKYVLREEGEK